MRKFFAIIAGKSIIFISRLLKIGAGSTWPGEVALKIYPSLITDLSSQLRQGVVIVAGTNGKTTTSLMINQILNRANYLTIHNATGANLLNGIASSLIQNTLLSGMIEADFGVFEVDENSLPLILANLKLKKPNFKLVLVLLNLFRDQLDRYGEVDVIADKWTQALQIASHQLAINGKNNFTLILNADDPLIVHLGKQFISNSKKWDKSVSMFKNKKAYQKLLLDNFPNLSIHIIYFGINDAKYFSTKLEHATDSIFCLDCGGRLNYSGIYFSHLGIWSCKQCGEKRPIPHISECKSALPGLYNQYNYLAAKSVGLALRIKPHLIQHTLDSFIPAFGRQEEFVIKNKRVKLFLSKNPAGFNASLRTVLELKPKVLLLILNDRIPDGRDVSWIWDVDFEMIPPVVQIIVSGDRADDMAVRIKYSTSQKENLKFKIKPNFKKAISEGLRMINQNETLYILPNYSAMLEVRKILLGRKIL